MPFTREQLNHLQECWKSAHIRVNAENKKHLLALLRAADGSAERRTNGDVYVEAALSGFRNLIEAQIAVTLETIDQLGILVDEEVEKVVMSQINTMTNIPAPLHLPGGFTGERAAAYEGSYSTKRDRLSWQLRREAADRLRAAKLKSKRSDVPMTSQVWNLNGANSRVNINSVDSSTNVAHEITRALEKLVEVSAGHRDLENLAGQIREAYPDKKTVGEKMKTWLTVAGSIAGLAEKAHQLLPIIESWLHGL